MTTVSQNDTRRITAELRAVQADLKPLSGTVTPADKIGKHLIDRLRIATDNVAGCLVLAEHGLVSPVMVLGRTILESLFVTYWATLKKENADVVLRRECQEILHGGLCTSVRCV
jgi:hypothetical protein